ncbi:MAG TPA: hypothetical protein VFT43_13290 [Candidatus Polarisedimenticolia bacterium]|nr:hypothetical protein [Candidatus Polarisedimenticolia bacterium]
MTLLSESFAGINARFHLAGIYALATLVPELLIRLVGPADRPDLDWLGVALTAIVVSIGVLAGVCGLVFQAATGRTERFPFAYYAILLYLPLAWLILRIEFLVFAPPWLAAEAYQALVGVSADPTLNLIVFWAGPLLTLTMGVLLLYSVPLCILAREQKRRRAAIREGLGMLRSCPSESARLIGLVLLAVGIGAAYDFWRGFEKRDAEPDVAYVLVVSVMSYLELVGLFGASRVVLARARRPAPSDLGDGRDIRTSGPPA